MKKSLATAFMASALALTSFSALAADKLTYPVGLCQGELFIFKKGPDFQGIYHFFYLIQIKVCKETKKETIFLPERHGFSPVYYKIHHHNT